MNEFAETAKRMYGTTSRWREGCFILPDGEILNCLDPTRGLPPDTRSETHSMVATAVMEKMGLLDGNEAVNDLGPISALERLGDMVRIIAWEHHDRGCYEAGFEWSSDTQLTPPQLSLMRYMTGNCSTLSWGVIEYKPGSGSKGRFCASGHANIDDANQRWRTMLGSLERCRVK